MVQPASSTIGNVGSAITLTAGVTGNTGTPTYRWYKGDTIVFSDTKNEATSNFVITSVTADSAGVYRCEVSMTTGDATTGPYKSNDATIATRDVAASFGATTDTTERSEKFTCTYTGDDNVASVTWANKAGDVTDNSLVRNYNHFHLV